MRNAVWMSVINVVIAGVLALIIYLSGGSLAKTVGLAFVGFVVPSLLEILYFLEILKDRHDYEQIRFGLENDINQKLNMIANDWRQIISNRNVPNVFRLIISQRIAVLTGDVHKAAEQNLLRVSEKHMTDLGSILQEFDGKTVKEFWEIYKISVDEDERIFLPHSQEYFSKLNTLVSSKVVKVKRGLMVVSDPDRIPKRARSLKKFYGVTPGYEMKVVSLERYTGMFSDAKLDTCEDFGLFDHRLLFRTLQYEPYIYGYFVCDPVEVGNHRELFNTLWDTQILVQCETPDHTPSLAEVLSL